MYGTRDGKMFERICNLYEKYKALILYVFFGAITVLINICIYTICYEKVGISNTWSNIIAWILAVLFAFVTNKMWVFESRGRKKKEFLFELCSFFGCRLATGGIDILLMYVAVDVLLINPVLMKVLSNIIVIILNYVASKLIIFRKKESKNIGE